jgi:DNA polymerase-3 subunit gamma/tau
MAYLALYRKYRPKSFDEMVGQESVARVIKNAVLTNRVSHAYLFSGPRGTGKTTSAKIIAKMVNCSNLIDGVPCGKCHSCLNILNSNDVIEIDAASNNGVDEIRELRDKVNLVPSESKYKIYIIDEVHMLTTQAFNALLKTLEEPPEHVIFILATTEIHKIPMTIISRCQKFQFTKIKVEELVDNLKRIALLEQIDVDDSVLYEIARLSDGCCRDAVNLFDQLNSYANGNISIEQLYEISGSVSYSNLYNVLNLVRNNDSVGIINFCNDINSSGKSIFKFVEELMLFIKDIISYKVGIDNFKIKDKGEKIAFLANYFNDSILYDMIEEFNVLLNKIKVSSYPSILLSVTLLRFVDNHNLNLGGADSLIENNNDLDNRSNVNEVPKLNKLNVGLCDNELEIRINNSFVGASKEKLNFIKNKWNEIENYLIDSEFSSLIGILKDCSPVVASDKYLIVTARYDSLVSRFNNSYKNIERFLSILLGKPLYVVAISDEKWTIEKKKYIDNLKNGIKYEIKSLDEGKDIEDFDKKNLKNDVQNDVDVLKDLVGNDIIKYIN